MSVLVVASSASDQERELALEAYAELTSLVTSSASASSPGVPQAPVASTSTSTTASITGTSTGSNSDTHSSNVSHAPGASSTDIPVPQVAGARLAGDLLCCCLSLCQELRAQGEPCLDGLLLVHRLLQTLKGKETTPWGTGSTGLHKQGGPVQRSGVLKRRAARQLSSLLLTSQNESELNQILLTLDDLLTPRTSAASNATSSLESGSGGVDLAVALSIPLFPLLQLLSLPPSPTRTHAHALLRRLCEAHTQGYATSVTKATTQARATGSQSEPNEHSSGLLLCAHSRYLLCDSFSSFSDCQLAVGSQAEPVVPAVEASRTTWAEEPILENQRYTTGLSESEQSGGAVGEAVRGWEWEGAGGIEEGVVRWQVVLRWLRGVRGHLLEARRRVVEEAGRQTTAGSGMDPGEIVLPLL